MTDQCYYMSRSSIKTTKSHKCPAKTRVSLYILSAQSDQSLRCTREECITFGFLATQTMPSKGSDQSAQLHRPVCAAAQANLCQRGAHVIL